MKEKSFPNCKSGPTVPQEDQFNCFFVYQHVRRSLSGPWFDVQSHHGCYRSPDHWLLFDVDLSIEQPDVGWPWPCLQPFCLKTSSPAPSVWKSSPTQCQHHAATASARPASPPIGTGWEAVKCIGVRSARSPFVSDLSSILTEPWRKSLSSSRGSLILVERKIPAHSLTIITTRPCLHLWSWQRCQIASLLRWCLVFSSSRLLKCLTATSSIPVTRTSKEPVESILTRHRAMKSHLHPTHHPAGTKANSRGYFKTTDTSRTFPQYLIDLLGDI